MKRKERNWKIIKRGIGLWLLCLLLLDHIGNALEVQARLPGSLLRGNKRYIVFQEEDDGQNQDIIREPSELYAQAAVLMDADSGRILFAKNGQEERAMASTTKIMTCILALEYGRLDEIITASSNAASQPAVRLGVQDGEQFYLRDLLYSLMLESHNDAAVVIAESVGTSVEGFADMMNQKAEELGCTHTYFITPNGLDAEDENGTHHTTAEDLARIMKYCIMDSPQRRMFLEITKTPDYQFTDCSGSYSYSCTNHNALLHMMDGALSGKTGFTADAGYCYVGAVENEGRTYIAALLACGWPNNKGYKWADMKKLMAYGMEHFHYQTVNQTVKFPVISVRDGVPDDDLLSGNSTVQLIKSGNPETDGIKLLLRDDEQITVETETKTILQAPVEAGTYAGNVFYKLGDEIIHSYQLVTDCEVDRRDYSWCMEEVVKRFCMK